MPAPIVSTHPLAEAAGRAARAAGTRAEQVAEHRVRLRDGIGVTVADAADADGFLVAARTRAHEAERRCVTLQLARAHHVVGQNVLDAARRLARLTLAEDVRGTPLDP